MAESATALRNFYVGIAGHGLTGLVDETGKRYSERPTAPHYRRRDQFSGQLSDEWWSVAELKSRGYDKPHANNKKEWLTSERPRTDLQAERFTGCVIEAEHGTQAQEIYKKKFGVGESRSTWTVFETDLEVGPANEAEAKS